MNKLSYSLGLGIGQQLLQMGIDEFDVNDFAAAVKDVLEGKDPQIGHREAQTIVQTYFQQQEEKLNREKEAKGKIAKEEGEKYLAANAKKEGVVTRESGLQYLVLKEGTGRGDCYLFIPIHCREKSAGYLAMKNPIYLMEQQFLFDLINTFLSGMEILYQKECLARANEKLSDLSVKDALTGLYNRLGFGEYAEKLIADGHKEGRQMLILYSDLDMLKYLNDTYGHEVGDKAIICSSNELKEHVTPEGMCFRLGGDEFLIIDKFMSDEIVRDCIVEIRENLVRDSRKIELPVDLSLSFGYVVTEGKGKVSLDEYISRADTLMYEDKRRRRKGRI